MTMASETSKSKMTPVKPVDTQGVIISTVNDLPGYRVVRIFGAVYGVSAAQTLNTYEIIRFTSQSYGLRNTAQERLIGE